MDYKEDKYINEMANHMLNSNLALFIGAGFSNIFGYPSWGKLLYEIINEFKLSKYLQSTSLFSFIKEDEFANSAKINDIILEKLLGVDYLRLAGYIDYILKKEHGISIHQAVSDKIKKYEELRIKNDDIKYLIDFFKEYKGLLEDIITTNYDSNIEYCLDNEVTVIHRNLESLNHISYKNKVFKIHGCISDVGEETSGIVITEKDYNNFKNKNKYLFYKIYSFFTEKKIVFIGYSINDPNIRSLLNDVIEENEGKVGLQIYLVTRDRLKDLDKQYYQENFKLKIIEEMEIIDFFRKLNIRVEKNLELREAVSGEFIEFCKVYIENYEDTSFIEDIFDNKKEKDVLQYLYNQLIEEESRKVFEPYFTLLTKCKKNLITENRSSIQNILEIQNRMIFRIFKLIECDEEFKAFVKSNNFIEIALDSLIAYSKGNHPFGEYAESIKYLFLAYSLFKVETKERIDEFIDALLSNIISSCSDNPKYLGYDWHGLGVVKDNIKLLDEEDLNKLIGRLSRNYIDEIRYLQLKYVIMYSGIDDMQKQNLMYKNLYSKEFSSSISPLFRRAMKITLIKKYGFERSEEGTYVLDDFEFDFQTETNENKITYSIKVLNKEEVLFKLIQDFINNNIVISINDEPRCFRNYEEFEKYEEKIENMINCIIDAYLKTNSFKIA